MRSSRQRSSARQGHRLAIARRHRRECAPGGGADGQPHGDGRQRVEVRGARPGDREDAERHVLGGVGVGRGGHRGAVHAGDGRLVGLPDHTHASKL